MAKISSRSYITTNGWLFFFLFSVPYSLARTLCLIITDSIAFFLFSCDPSPSFTYVKYLHILTVYVIIRTYLFLSLLWFFFFSPFSLCVWLAERHV